MTVQFTSAEPEAPPEKEEAPVAVNDEGASEAFGRADTNTTRGIDSVSTSGESVAASVQASLASPPRDWDDAYDRAVQDVLMSYAPNVRGVDRRKLAGDVVAKTKAYAEKAGLGSYKALSQQVKRPHPSQIATLILATEDVRVIELVPESSSSDGVQWVGVYQHSGPDAGIYATNKAQLKRIVRAFTKQENAAYTNEVIEALKVEAPAVALTRDADLIPVANGVFHHARQELLPFSPEWVFVNKSPVRFVSDAPLPVLVNDEDGTEWDPDTGIAALSTDPEIVELLWEIISMVMRPHHQWETFPMLYARGGKNGKSLVIRILRALVGDRAYAKADLVDMSRRFLSPELLAANAVLADENPVNKKIDDVGNFKAIVMGEPVSFEQKGVDRFTVQLGVAMVMAFNEFPKVDDRSGSWYRRLLMVPFDVSFLGVVPERDYIKKDYAVRPEVLEYILCRALTMRHTSLSRPAATVEALDEYRSFNDAVRAFWGEFGPRFAWDGLPWDFLHDLFKTWHLRTFPGQASVPSLGEFKNGTVDALESSLDWDVPNKAGAQFRAAAKMNGPESLIVEFDLKRWGNPLASRTNTLAMSHYLPKAQDERFRGVVRSKAAAIAQALPFQPAEEPAET